MTAVVVSVVSILISVTALVISVKAMRLGQLAARWTRQAEGWQRDTPWGERARVSWDGFLRCVVPSGALTEVALTPLTPPSMRTTVRMLRAADKWVAVWARMEQS